MYLWPSWVTWPSLPGRWLDRGLVDQVCPWLTALPQALKAAGAGEEDALLESRSSSTTSHVLEVGSVEGEWPRCVHSPPQLSLPRPLLRGPGGPAGASKSSFPACLWASPTQQWAGYPYCLWDLSLCGEEGYMCVLNTQNFPKTPGFTFVFTEGAFVLSA